MDIVIQTALQALISVLFLEAPFAATFLCSLRSRGRLGLNFLLVFRRFVEFQPNLGTCSRGTFVKSRFRAVAVIE